MLQKSSTSLLPEFVHHYPSIAILLMYVAPGMVCSGQLAQQCTATSIRLVYFRLCTCFYIVGSEIKSAKSKALIGSPKTVDPARFSFIESIPRIHDIVRSVGDPYLLEPGQLHYLGKRDESSRMSSVPAVGLRVSEYCPAGLPTLEMIRHQRFFA